MSPTTSLNQEKTGETRELTGISELSLTLGAIIMAHVTGPRLSTVCVLILTTTLREEKFLFIYRGGIQGTGTLSRLNQVIKWLSRRAGI